jgi:hypothetical protein
LYQEAIPICRNGGRGFAEEPLFREAAARATRPPRFAALRNAGFFGVDKGSVCALTALAPVAGAAMSSARAAPPRIIPNANAKAAPLPIARTPAPC